MRVLAIQPGAIGDFILSLPALGALRQLAGGDTMELWAERGNLVLAGRLAGTRPLAETGFDSWPLPERTLRRMREFELVVSWRGARRPDLVSAVQAVHPRAYFLDQFPAAGRRQHICDFRREQLVNLFCDQLRNADSLERPPRLLLTEHDLEEANALLHRWVRPGECFAVLHPGASGVRKQWGVRNFAAVAERLRTGGHRLLASEGPLDRDAVNALAGCFASDVIKRLVVDDLRVLGAIAARADVFIGNDTGIAHLAAAAGARTIAIFVDTDPAIWAPRGEEVTVLVQPTADEVLAAAARRRRIPQR